MFSVILYMLRKTVGHRAPPYSFHLFPPLTVTFPKLSVILRPLYFVYRSSNQILLDRWMTALWVMASYSLVEDYWHFQVLTAASMMFRVVFWDILPCKMIVGNVGRQSFYTAVYPRRQLWTRLLMFQRCVLRSSRLRDLWNVCEIWSSHGGEYDVHSCLLGCTAV
jgi:hypothetical protein